ncbi:MAG: acyl-CoA synthetase FdrA [Chloroflexi bacterium]|nr:acyl-CoA synthetase FdrA [Chloroflexota bacterium]
MPHTLAEIRPGAYYDSVVLMQLQRTLADLPGVHDAGVVMCTSANKELLEQSGLLTPEIPAAAPEDLVIVVRADDAEAARSALAQVDDLLARRRSTSADDDYRPKSLDSAAKMLPEAGWALISVPGRYAAGVARQALELGKNVFLYSDNVSLEDEISLKNVAAAKGLLVMGPDCGTAIVDGVGLGFANRVRRGKIGVVAASGTGLQAVTVGIHRLGGGITQAYGTGGRDLSEAVGGVTARQALTRLAADSQTEVIVLVSKPPAPAVAEELLALARQSGKPVVVDFIGYSPAEAQRRRGGEEEGDKIRFVQTLDEAAELAVALSGSDGGQQTADGVSIHNSQFTIHPFDRVSTGSTYQLRTPHSLFLRALYSGGTLAYEALLLLQEYLPVVYSNAPLKGGPVLDNPHESRGHTVVDLGGDEFTVGRLHPMLDNDLRIRRIHAEAAHPETGLLLLDVVLGDGAHPDPASELAPAIRAAIATANAAGRKLSVVAVVVGTDADPQGPDSQIDQLSAAGAIVFTRHDEAVRAVGGALTGDGGRRTTDSPRPTADGIPNIQYPISFSALNVGLESFTDSLKSQGAAVVHVDWKPPAGGNEKLMGILARMRGKKLVTAQD